MPGEVVSAGSFVAAAMELAGYRIQGVLLREFQDFFKEAGAFIYVLAGVGAVVSYTTMGSFRAVRYLLIGPAMFWFLVTPTVKYDAVQWKIGAGEARGLNNRRGEAISRQDVSRAVNDAFGASQTTEVAYAFGFFTRVINELTNELVKTLLGGEEDSYYSTFLHRGQALDAFLNLRPRNAFTIHAIDGSLINKGCIEYVGNSLALAMPQISEDVINALIASNASTTAQVAQARRTFYETKVRTLGEQQRGNITEMTWAQLSLQPNADQRPRPPINLPCNDIWRRAATLLQQAGDMEAKRVIDLAKMESPNRLEACKIVMKKIAEGEPGADCEQKLKHAAAIMITKNLLTDRQSLSKFIGLLMNRSVNPGNNTTIRGLTMDQVRGGLNNFGNNAIYAAEHFNPIQNVEIDGVMRNLTADGSFAGDPRAGDQLGQARAQRRWREGTRLHHLGGTNLTTDATFIDFPRYNTRKLAQQLFTWALNAPWWQGTILYLISLSYPFVALVVLIPGRAQSILLLPMAWLWVKTWDVGFAMVLVLERVLWNTFPSMEFRQSKLVPIQSLPLHEVLSEAQKSDPIWSIHSYFLVMAAALLSVPAITGYVTLKSRRAILASFTDKLLGDVKSAGDLAAGNVQIQAAAARAQLMGELQHEAVQNIRTPAREARRRAIADAHGNMARDVHFAQSAPFRSNNNLLRGGISRATQLIRSLTHGMQQALDMQIALEQDERQYAIMFDPVNGSFGIRGTFYDLEKVRNDASNGYELDGDYTGSDNPIDKYIALHKLRVQTAFGGLTNVLSDKWLQNRFTRTAFYGFGNGSFDTLLFGQDANLAAGARGLLETVYGPQANGVPGNRHLYADLQINQRLYQISILQRDRAALQALHDAPGTNADRKPDLLRQIRALDRSVEMVRAEINWIGTNTRATSPGYVDPTEPVGENRQQQLLDRIALLERQVAERRHIARQRMIEQLSPQNLANHPFATLLALHMSKSQFQQRVQSGTVVTELEAYARQRGWGYSTTNPSEWSFRNITDPEQREDLRRYEAQIRRNFTPVTFTPQEVLGAMYGLTADNVQHVVQPSGQYNYSAGMPPALGHLQDHRGVGDAPFGINTAGLADMHLPGADRGPNSAYHGFLGQLESTFSPYFQQRANHYGITNPMTPGSFHTVPTFPYRAPPNRVGNSR